jgi:hypothetical protein
MLVLRDAAAAVLATRGLAGFGGRQGRRGRDDRKATDTLPGTAAAGNSPARVPG